MPDIQPIKYQPTEIKPIFNMADAVDNIDTQDFLSLIKTGEHETIEFKKSTAQLEKSLRTICGFLNHKGGIVYFGISDKNEIVGQEVSDSTLKSISQKIRQKIKPEIHPEIRVIELDNKKIIEVKIKEGTNKPYYLDSIAYKRVGSESLSIPPDELEIIILKKNRRQWDSEVCEDATLEDIDDKKVKWFLRKAKYERKFDVDLEILIKEVLIRLKFLKYNKLTNSAVLLFGKNPQKFVLQSVIRCARFKGFTPTDFIDLKIIDGNFFDLLKKTKEFILSHIKKAAKVVMFNREEVWEYPPDAIREAVVNAIVHRDYLIQGNIRAVGQNSLSYPE
ncbi:MAG: putative DNA binding domain-containing protein [DPANN group archaeon]|nr:putative DNA binding domain-containing protein [DPANN group archaeon]